jgi:phage tail sheath gpL-like
MANLKVKIECGMNAETMVREFERSSSSKYDDVQAIAELLESILGGNQSQPSVMVSVEENEDRATGTFTLDTVIATDAVSINGVTFTAVASGATGNQFNVGADDEETAENLAAAINASVTALVAGYVTAEAAGAVVTITSAFPGLAGNQTTIASADATIVASGERLEDGAVDPAAKTYTF